MNNRDRALWMQDNIAQKFFGVSSYRIHHDLRFKDRMFSTVASVLEEIPYNCHEYDTLNAEITSGELDARGIAWIRDRMDDELQRMIGHMRIIRVISNGLKAEGEII